MALDGLVLPRLIKHSRRGKIFFEQPSNLPSLERIRKHNAGVNTGRLKYLLPDCLRHTPYLTLDTNFADPLNTLQVVSDLLNTTNSGNGTLRSYALKSMYGEIKTLETLASESVLVTQGLVLNELRRKQTLLGRKSQTLACDLVNFQGGVTGIGDELGYVQEINELYGRLIANLSRNRDRFTQFDQRSADFATTVFSKIREGELTPLEYRTKFRRKKISLADLALFDFSRRLNSTLLSTDGDMPYLSARIRIKIPICDCTEELRDDLSQERVQVMFGRYVLK